MLKIILGVTSMFSIAVSTVVFGAGIVLNSALSLMLWMYPVQVTDQDQVQTTVPVQLGTSVVQAAPSYLQNSNYNVQ